jgi:hypothetical protein
MTKVPNLDLHGVAHNDALLIIEEWALMWSYRVPGFVGKIIPGNSSKMKTLALSALKKHNFDYNLMGDGSILVNGKL